MPTPPPAANLQWTIQRVLHWACGYLRDHGIESPRSAAEILLAHALGTERIHLYMYHDKPLEKSELSVFKDYLRRRIRREPVAYIVGRKGFWSLDLSVNPAVLIPRPETECLVEAALSVLAGHASVPAARILDLGTGSGAIVLALAIEAGGHRFFASDVSPEAVAVARKNAADAGLCERVRFFVGDWLSAVRPDPLFDLIVANPPYVAAREMVELQPEIVGYEPRLALNGDEDGLRSYRAILAAAHRHLKPAGTLVLEIGSRQREAVQLLAEQTGAYQDYRCQRDYGGHERVVLMQKKDVASHRKDC